MSDSGDRRGFTLLRGKRANRKGDYPTFGGNDRGARIGCLVIFVLAVLTVLGFGLAKILYYSDP